MKYSEDIGVLGDIHGEYGKLSMLVNHMPEVKLWLQTGDMGFWPNHTSKRDRKRGQKSVPMMQGATLMFCDGNHEDHDTLQMLDNNEVYPDVHYMKRGSTFTLPDGRVVLFMGGAESTDKEWRVESEQVSGERIWFPRERITQIDLMDLPDIDVDIVISHAAPREFEVFGSGHDMKECDPTRLALSSVLHRYKRTEQNKRGISLWFFGHYHARIKGEYKGLKYYGLNMAGHSDWWMKLPAAGGEQ